MKRKERRLLLLDYISKEFKTIVEDFFSKNGGDCKINDFNFEPHNINTIAVYPVSANSKVTLNEVVIFDISLMFFTKMGKYGVRVSKPNGLTLDFQFRAHGWDDKLKGENAIWEDNIEVIHSNLNHILIYSFALIQFKQY